jgi:tetratricopeptide (TPR) repeat protein
MVKKSDLKKLNSIMQEGNESKNLKEYNKAVEKYLEALRFIEERVKEPEEREDETTNIKSQIDQVYSVKIIDIIEKARNFIITENYNSAFNTFDEAARIADKIVDEDLKNYEVEEISYLINKTRIDESLFQAVLVKNNQELDKALSMLHDTLNAAKDFYMEDLEDQMIKKIEDTINQIYSLKVSTLIENANRFKGNGNLDKALEEFQKAMEFADKYFDSELKETDKKNLIDLSNYLYSEKINIVLEDGKKLFEENTFTDAAEKFEEAISTSEKMYNTDYKKSEIIRINSMAAEVLNPIYLEKINPIFNKGKELIIKDNFEEDIVVVNEALDFFDMSLELANKMADSNDKSQILTKINNSIKKTCKIRIKFIKEKSIQKIGQRDYEKAINDLYAAISVAKRLPVSDETSEDLEDLKNTVNKVYLAQINEVVREGNDKLVSKNYDEAIKIFNSALVMTNKMYLTQEMEEEINRIKSLVYQAELKDLVDRGDLSEEIQKFEKEIDKLKKKMDYAKTIDDPTRRFQEMEQIKTSIDEVFYSKIKLLVEQGVQLADSKNFKESFENFENAITINESIKSPEFKNRIAIKYEYKLKLIEKANIELEKQNYDNAIEDCKKAIELDSTYIDAYYYIGIANNYKQEFNSAISYFKKSIDLNSNFAKSWNHMGISYEKLGQFDKAIDSYKKAVEFESNYSVAYFNLANAYKHENQIDFAIESYEKAIEIDQNYAHAWLFMGYAYLEKNDYFSGIQHLEKAISIDPKIGEKIADIISDVKNSIEKLQKSLSEKFNNK